MARRLQIHYFLLFAPFAIATTYQNLHFKRLGFTDSQIGTLGAIGAVLTVVSPLLWGYLTDRVRDKRLPISLLLLVSGLTYLPFLSTGSYWAVAALQAVFFFFMAPCSALVDAQTLEHLPRAGGDYGRLRLWGSVGFICTLLLFGLVLGGGPLSGRNPASSLAMTFIAFAAIRVVSTFWTWRLPSGEQGCGRVGYGGDLLLLLRDRVFLLFLLSVLLCMTALRAYYVFFSIYLDERGVADNLKGVYWSLGVVAEVVFMVFAGRLLRFLGVRWMLALGMLGGALRLFLFSFSLAMPFVALAQCLHALAFGATHIAAVTFINARVPARLRASGQTLYAAVVGGLGGAAGSRLAGDLAQASGIPYAFRAAALLAGVAALMALLLPRAKPVDESEPEEPV